MSRFKLRDQLVVKFLLIDFVIISCIGLSLLFAIDQYQAVTISLTILTISAPFVFLISWFTASKINKKLGLINEVIDRISSDEPSELKVKQTDEFDQLINNLNFSNKKFKARLQNLKKELAYLKQAINSLKSSVILIDSGGEITFANTSAENIFGNKSWMGKQIIEAFKNHNLSALVEKAMLGKHSEAKIDIHYPETKSLNAVAFPLEKDKTIKGCAVIVEDTTAMDELASVKKDLVANVSHELRTPIATLKSLTEALMASGLEDREMGLQFVKDVMSQVERLSEMVRDLLDLSELESEKTKKQGKVSMAKLINEVTANFKTKCQLKNVKIETNIQPRLPVISADKEQLIKAFSNLMDNAVKFSPEGGKVSVKINASNGSINVSFVDKGPGIKQKDLDRIFERFYTGFKDRGAGTGLGLSIAKHAVEKHSGLIKVKSTWGKGSEFKVILPTHQLRA